MRIVTFSKYCDHSSPFLKKLKIIKLYDLITLHVSCFMYKHYYKLLPPVFNDFFIDVHAVHNYNTRLSSKNHIIFPRQELTMVYLTQVSWGLKLGIILMKLLNCSLFISLRKG